MRIHLLDPLVANQIAAGEVIERPASVVKELLENSLDAGSGEIHMDIHKGGSELIQVQDNGCGIHKEDLALAVRRHGTSKIKDLNDLQAIASLGFRGEALASICAVARVKITSCVEACAAAWQLIAEGTQTHILEKPAAHPRGTRIEVRDLFFNTPARRRFLRTEKTEFSHIEEVVKRIGLSNFNIRLTLNHNGRTILNLLPATTQTLREKRIKQIFPARFMDHALGIEREAVGLKLSGWIADAGFTRNQADLQYLYINGRMVRDKLLHHAIRQAYADTLDYRKYPAFILFLACDPAIVDVNVHPTKHEVRFHEARLIHDFVFSALRNALNAQAQAPFQTRGFQDASAQADKVFKIAEPLNPYQVLAAPSADDAVTATRISSADENNSGKLSACLNHQYLLLETAAGLRILSVKKLRQKLLFNHLNHAADIKKKPLLFPITLKPDTMQYANFQAHHPHFNAAGFELDEIDAKRLLLRSAPDILAQADFHGLMARLLSVLKPENAEHEFFDILAAIAPAFMETELDADAQTRLIRDAASLSQAEQKQAYYDISFAELENFFR